MSKQSPEQYLKYLAALSLAVAGPVAAEPADIADPAPIAATASPSGSSNLEALAATVTGETAVAAAPAGCTGWPESTYVRRATPKASEPRPQERDQSASLDSLVKEVLGDLT